MADERDALGSDVLGCVTACAGCTYGARKLAERSEAHSHLGRLYGVWDFDTFAFANPGDAMFTEKLAHDMSMHGQPTAWSRLMFENSQRGIIQLPNGVLDYVDVADDGNLVKLTDSGDATWVCQLVFQPTGKDLMSMEGTINGHAVHGALSREDESQFLLTKRRFHWVNEW